jgi:hypothetical protein
MVLHLDEKEIKTIIGFYEKADKTEENTETLEYLKSELEEIRK